MKRSFPFLVLLLCLTATRSFAQAPAGSEMKIPYIELTGVAEREIVPDEIYIKITLKERYVSKEKITIESQEEKMKTAFKEIGLNMNDLYLTDVKGGVVYIRRKAKDMLTNKNYTLKVNNATVVGKVFQKLDELEIDDASIARVDHSKIDSIRKEIRILAIKAARDKADYLLGAIGEQTGKPWVVMEVNEAQRIYFDENMISNNSYANYTPVREDTAPSEIQFQTITVRSAMYVKFAIK